METMVQHIKHTCKKQEFEAYERGEKSFDIKVNDGKFELATNDLITIDEVDDEGNRTGRSVTKKVGAVLNTKQIDNITDEEIIKKGLTICSLIDVNAQTLYAIYAKYFTISFTVDRDDKPNKEDVTYQHGRNWRILGGVSYTPMLICPQFDAEEIAESMHVDKWPEGKYSITLLLDMDLQKREPPYDVEVKDSVIMTVTQAEDGGSVPDFIELSLEALTLGKAISIYNHKKVQPLHPDIVDDMLLPPANKEFTDKHDELMSEEEMQKLLAEAHRLGQEVTTEDLQYEDGEECEGCDHEDKPL